MNDKVRQKHMIQVDLSGCKNMEECMKVMGKEKRNLGVE